MLTLTELDVKSIAVAILEALKSEVHTNIHVDYTPNISEKIIGALSDAKIKKSTDTSIASKKVGPFIYIEIKFYLAFSARMVSKSIPPKINELVDELKSMGLRSEATLTDGDRGQVFAVNIYAF
jgi:hypothetical protein